MFWDFDVLDVGSIVHDTIDSYYKMHYLSNIKNKNELFIEIYTIFKNKWNYHLDVDKFKKGYTCLENFCTWEYKNVLNKITTKPLTEQKISAEGFYGIIDYINPEKNEAIDWKTNTYPNLSENYEIQAIIYKILYEEKFNFKLKKFKFYYLYPNILRKIDYKNEKMKKLKDDVVKIKNKIINSVENNDFSKDPKEKSECKNCLYRFYCIKSERNEQTNI